MHKKLSVTGILGKARSYCARQERAQQEVRDKLYLWGAHQNEVESAIAQLIGEGYLNEARFAEHFAVSKFRQKGWGRRKIEAALKLRKVSGPCITLGLKAIDNEEYEKGLLEAIRKRADRITDTDPYIRRGRLVRYFLGKGYSMEQIERALKSLVNA